jgi:hypothetical protein
MCFDKMKGKKVKSTGYIGECRKFIRFAGIGTGFDVREPTVDESVLDVRENMLEAKVVHRATTHRTLVSRVTGLFWASRPT